MKPDRRNSIKDYRRWKNLKILKSRERFMGIGQVLAMQLFFASNAIYPLAIMLPWLKFIAHLNPLTCQVDAPARLDGSWRSIKKTNKKQ